MAAALAMVRAVRRMIRGCNQASRIGGASSSGDFFGLFVKARQSPCQMRIAFRVAKLCRLIMATIQRAQVFSAPRPSVINLKDAALQPWADLLACCQAFAAIGFDFGARAA